MSTTAITLMMSNYEVSDDTCNQPAHRIAPPYLLQIVNQFLVDKYERPLAFVGGFSNDPAHWRVDGYGGDSKPYLAVAVGGYRDLCMDTLEELKMFFENLPFRYPEVAALIYRVDAKEVTVFRPSEYE